MDTTISPARAANIMISHGFTQGCIGGVLDRAVLHGRATVRWSSIGKEATVVRRGADVELTITRVVAMHRHVVDDFEHFRPGDHIVWYHGPTNRRQNGTITAWSPEYRINALGTIVCLQARAVIYVDDLAWGMGMGKRDLQVAEMFLRYGSCIEMVYR
ncbi:hypothetical protein [Nocardia sp. NRRL S-836]|uniref:hypothetical protein n=1 Tax=Nocardia sp. NRRL S-836 TaxID=1519492 RepID=UPI0006AEF3C4|nr:hypothetical protein [Nocardia sp. NRRL S-836]KOV84633.1 hypothetical protein ADL03_15165 [Nocardia sp. NRRL S-836]